jgi:transcriptional regulator with XRE-family HTH domain
MYILCQGQYNNHKDRVALPICQIVLKAQKPLKKAYPNILITIGDHIRKKRSELNLTQLQAAKIIGVDECTITNWEKSHSQTKIHYLPKIIQFLGYIPFNIKADSLGEQIKLYRRIRGILQKTLAKEIGIDPCTLARWERNNGILDSNLICHISKFFNSLNLTTNP